MPSCITTHEHRDIQLAGFYYLPIAQYMNSEATKYHPEMEASTDIDPAQPFGSSHIRIGDFFTSTTVSNQKTTPNEHVFLIILICW